VLRLIDSQDPATRKLDVSHPPPRALFNVSRGDNSFSLKAYDGSLEVVAHQIELVPVFVGGMKGHLRWGQAEDQPTAAGVDRLEPEDIVEQVAIRLGIVAVHDHVSPADHSAQSRSEGTVRKDWEKGVGAGLG
jgi:hypothetical protein